MGVKLNIFTGQLEFAGSGGGQILASNVIVVPSGNLTSTNAQDALEELQGEIDNYSDTFNNTTDWSGPTGGFYTITYPQATHQKGIAPKIMIFENELGNFNVVDVDRVQVTPAGDIEIRVPSSPDLRFNGKIVIGA